MLKLRHEFFSDIFRRKAGCRHELGFKYGADRLDATVEVGSHPTVDRVQHPALAVDDIAGAPFAPASIQRLRGRTKLGYEIVRRVVRIELASLPAPESQEGCFIVTQYDLGIGTTDEPKPL
jgi:hypothetical protein